MLRILHAADLHLDSPFASLSPEQAAQRRALQRKLPQALAELCARKQCDLLLLAGDVFDGELVCPETVEALQAAFKACPAEVFIAPGNHDPYTASSPWALCQWPENVHLFTGAMEAVSLPRLRCRVWGAGFRERTAFELLHPIPKADDGFLEIGLFHGDPLHTGDYHPISGEVLRTCGLDYLALGHIHKTCLPRKAGRTWVGWPGAAMGRGFDETGEKGVFCVELDSGGCQTEFLPLPVPQYRILNLSAENVTVPPEYVGSICRVILTGEAWDFDETTLDGQFLSMELRDETVPKRDLWAECGENTLRGLTLKTLKLRYDSAKTAEERQLAVLAAKYALAALEGREQP